MEPDSTELLVKLAGNVWLWVSLVVLVALMKGVKFVPQNSAWVVQRFGKYNRTLNAGMNFIMPFIDRIAYNHTLKEQVIDVPEQAAITKDNISLGIDGVLYIKVVDAQKASYGAENYRFAVTNLAQTTMRSEIGKIELDKTFEEREQLNINIVTAINEAAEPWGVQVLRYEIKDINPPSSVLQSMERQMKAERDKRAEILESEGKRQYEINVAEGSARAVVLAAEADKQQKILAAQGEAAAKKAIADAEAYALTIVGESAASAAGHKAVELQLASSAIDAQRAIAKEGTVLVLNGVNGDGVTDTVAKAVGIAAAMDRTIGTAGSAAS